MFTSFKAKLYTLAATFVVDRKRQQTKDVVSAAIDSQLLMMPVILDAYREQLHKLVDATFDKPQVLLAFVNASTDLIEHYAPALEGFDAHVIAKRFDTDTITASLKNFGDKLELLADAQR